MMSIKLGELIRDRRDESRVGMLISVTKYSYVFRADDGSLRWCFHEHAIRVNVPPRPPRRIKEEGA